jgi:hypothetical protein
VTFVLHGIAAECARVTRDGFAAIGFVSAFTGHRYQNRPMKQWFVSELPEALGSSVHDVQMILSPLTFNPVINPCGNQSASVHWELGCISLWDGDSGENCNDNDFDGDGPGCTELNNGLGKICGNRPNVGPGTDPLSYYAPRNLFTTTFAPNVCEEQNNGNGVGLVPLTATVFLQSCPAQGCQATACITVTPP